MRAAFNWLHIYFEERKKEEVKFHHNKLTDEDIAEFLFAYYNLYGVSKALDFILSWKPPSLIYRVTKKFIRRLIDANNFDAINEILQFDIRSQYLMLAITQELLEVGRFPYSSSMEQCLDLMANKRTRIRIPDFPYEDTTDLAVVAFAEACAAKGLPHKKILRVLRHYFPVRAPSSIASNFLEKDRTTYLRVVALRCVFSGIIDPKLDDLIPQDLVSKKQTYQGEQDVRRFKEVLDGLLPWYLLRARVIMNGLSSLNEEAKAASSKSKTGLLHRWHDNDTIPFEITRICIEILELFQNGDSPKQVQKFFADYIKENEHIWIKDRLSLLRSAYRLNHLSAIRSHLEKAAYDIVAAASDEGPETRAGWYIDLARAVLPVSRDDASTYFEYGIQAVSKFGNEIIRRWEAIVSLAERRAQDGYTSPEMAYRFIRCAELVGDNVAREKYIDRNKAVRICARLSPVSAFAALSRWRDRNVGYSAEQLPALAYESVHSNFISPKAGWSLSAFFKGSELEGFASLCINKEQSSTIRKYILKQAIRHLRLCEAGAKSWQKLSGVAQQYSIQDKELNDVLKFFSENPEKISKQDMPVPLSNQESVAFDEIFVGLELTSSSGISKALERLLATSKRYHNREEFWTEFYKRIEDGNAYRFLLALVTTENVNVYDVETALSKIPKGWLSKVSVQQNWANILKLIG